MTGPDLWRSSAVPDGGDAEVGDGGLPGSLSACEPGHFCPGRLKADLQALDLVGPAVLAGFGDPDEAEVLEALEVAGELLRRPADLISRVIAARCPTGAVHA